jgi:hypothetical protein
MVIAAVVAMVATFCARADAQTEITGESLRDVHIQAAIEAIAEELVRRKDPERFWEPASYGDNVAATQAGGYTALVVLSLLYAGDTYQSERLADAIAYLERVELGGTYAVAVRANIWALLPPKFERLLEEDKQWLLDGFSERVGGWNYQQEPNTGRDDNSIRQYGALGLWEASKRGLNVDDRYWRMLEQSILRMQLDDGGWNYQGDGPATGSMTTAGLMILFIAQDFLHAAEAVTLGRGSSSANQAAIDRGVAWMNANFSATTNPGRDLDFYYYLYGVERVGLAGGYRYFAGQDWYRLGAAELIARLCQWHPETATMTVHPTVGGNPRAGELKTVDLAFALMFLSRGRVPVAVNKLSDPSMAWNNRPRDVANLVRWQSGSSEHGYNWQVVDLAARPEEWLDAPMLYFASNEAPPWIPRARAEQDELVQHHVTHRARLAEGVVPADQPAEFLPPELLKIKRYLDLGGLLVANAEGRSPAFADAIEAMGRILYPHFSWRDLPADHSAYRQYRFVTDPKPALRGLSNGVRELIILSRETDLSEHLQGLTAAKAMEAPAAVMLNLAFHAAELDRARPRVEPAVLARTDMRTAAVSVQLVRATFGGAWDAEPAALEAFAAWAWNEKGIDVSISNAPLSTIDQLGRPADLVLVSGLEPHEFTQMERDAIRAYVQQGGVILFECPGGAGDFTTSAERTMNELFGESPRALLRHPVITGEGIAGAEALTRVEYRPYAFEVFGGRETAARLRGITLGEAREARVLFSREDISHALLDQPRWGISGYTPAWARRILANILHYAR